MYHNGYFIKYGSTLYEYNTTIIIKCGIHLINRTGSIKNCHLIQYITNYRHIYLKQNKFILLIMVLGLSVHAVVLPEFETA